jgi:hypothetical protein
VLLPLLSPILGPALVTGAALFVQETEGDAEPASDEPLKESTNNPAEPTL